MACSSHEIVLTSSPNGPITVYDTISGTTVARFIGSRSPRHGLALVGKAYIAASHFSSNTASGSIHLYKWWSTTAFHHLPVPEPVAPLAATVDGLFLFAGGLSGHVHAFSIPSGNILRSFPAHSKPVSCIIIRSDWSLLISGGDDGTIAVAPMLQLLDASRVDSSSKLMLQRFVAHGGPVTAITSCTGLCHATIISSSTDNTCKVWSLSKGTILRTIIFPCTISGIVLDSIEKEFYAAGSNGVVYKGCLRVGIRKGLKHGGDLMALAESHNGAVVSLLMVNGGKNLMSAAEDGNIYLWEVEKGKVINVLGNSMDSISATVLGSGFGDSAGVTSHMDEREGGCLEHFRKGVHDTKEIGDVLTGAEMDKSKTIDLLESAIGVYERLLELILEEVNGGNSRICEKKTDDDQLMPKEKV
ncbi:hypothetical protein K2173_018377 [Erythroxylum novogranatense]|uniref:Protein ROOT INITIATION DEFECTIVE 3-like n=1 Tax=Erythroxylum novogranatense TaxID=1862640 RepID=A0AAV8UAF6_9ROSI|nr:hypothetical protein K2173_018377 [Erythroxylum novogranatense]